MHLHKIIFAQTRDIIYTFTDIHMSIFFFEIYFQREISFVLVGRGRGRHLNIDVNSEQLLSTY